jgi:hypothetical protein
MKEIHFYSNEGPGLLQRGDNHKNVKMGWDHLKIPLCFMHNKILFKFKSF